MKGGIALADAKEEYKINGFCLVCGKGFQYPYGRHRVNGEVQAGTCSKLCERKYDATVSCRNDGQTQGG